MDGLDHPEVVQLAQMGSNGVHVNNIRRDLVRHNFRSMLSPSPMLIDLPLLDEQNVVVTLKQKILSPLAVMESLHALSPSLCRSVLAPNLREFWEGGEA